MRLLATILVLASTAPAAGRPLPPPEEEPRRPLIEWSSWVRGGYGAETEVQAEATARTVEVTRVQEARWDIALGGDATLPISDSGDVRVGPWVELRTDRIVAGGELVVMGVPGKLDLFHWVGTGILAMRVGGTPDFGTAQIAYGYSAPWKLWGPWRGSSRYMIGARLVGTYTRAHDDPSNWQATLGIEFEPIGALRYVLGIRSLY